MQTFCIVVVGDVETRLKKSAVADKSTTKGSPRTRRGIVRVVSKLCGTLGYIVFSSKPGT